MSMYDKFKTDKQLESEGVWFDFYDEGEPVFRVKLARAGRSNKKLVQRLEELFKPHRRAAELGAFPKDKEHQISVQAFTEIVIRGWEVWEADEALEDKGKWVSGIENLKGEVVSYSPAIGYEVLSEMRDIYEKLLEDSQTMVNFRVANREEDSKN